MSPLHILLASASPRRRELLSLLGHQVQVLPIAVDEAQGHDERPLAYLERIVEAKLSEALRSAAAHNGWDALLVADTVVRLHEQILHKPEDDRDAVHILRKLAGRTHQVSTRFALAHRHGRMHRETVTTAVHFRALHDDEIARYVATGEGRDKAGGYAIQGRAAAFVSRIEGSYGAVVGLPSCEVQVALQSMHTDSNR